MSMNSMICRSLFCFFFSFSATAQQHLFQPFPDLERRIGQHFPIEEYIDENGKNFSPDALTGKKTIINFWSAACVPCIKELPHLNQLQKQVGIRAHFIAITSDPKERAAAFVKKHPFAFRHITDAEKQLKSYFPVLRNPMNFILDAKGNIKEITGIIDESKTGIIAAMLMDD